MEQSLFRYVWKHSREEQLRVLALILLSMPIYFIALDLPRRIVNDGLQGGAFREGAETAPLFGFGLQLPQFLGGWSLFSFGGFQFGQVQYVIALSFLFLALVLINGGFKLVINVRKSTLGEQLLRKMRADLFALMLRFRPEDFRALKPAEAASIIKDEVEPIGGFAGDSIIQPFFLSAQALTALTFILVQNFWLGLVSVVVVAIQAVLIPKLRKRLIALSRQRQIEARNLSGAIGSTVEVGPLLNMQGAAAYQRWKIGAQLEKLLGIRLSIFNYKFAIKFLNNILAQLTPFFFYAVGGFFALRGQIDIGQLIAVIVAYRELPPPIKELIDWDHRRNDVTVKYEQVFSSLVDKAKYADEEDSRAEALPSDLDAKLEITNLAIDDAYGNTILEPVSCTIAAGEHVALRASGSSARSDFAKAIARQVSGYRGSISIGGSRTDEMSYGALSRLVFYVGSDPGLVPATIRDNVLLALRRTGMEMDAEDADDQTWIDFGMTGATNTEELDVRILDALTALGMRDDLYSFGLYGKTGASTDQATIDRLLKARDAIHVELDKQGLLRRVEVFDPDRYNANSTIGENLLFGIPQVPRWTDAEIGRNKEFLALLRAEGLLHDLVNLGMAVAETTIDMLSGVSPTDPLFERYSLIPPHEMSETEQRLRALQSSRGRERYRNSTHSRFVILALHYGEERYRFGLVDEPLANRIVGTRRALRALVDKVEPGAIDFYNPNGYTRAAPVRENLLFGRLKFGLPQVEKQIISVMRDILQDLGMDDSIVRLGLEYDVGPRGKFLTSAQRAAINLTRCLVKRTPIVILDDAVSAFSAAEEGAVAEELRNRLRDRTILMTAGGDDGGRPYDRELVFEGAKVVSVEREMVDAGVLAE